MKPETLVIVCIFLGFILLEIAFSKFFNKKGQKKEDAVVELFSSSVLILLTQPLVLLMGGLLAAQLLPAYEGIMTNWNVFAVLGLLLIFDDMTQYWWHRLSHTIPALYNLHRPHHEAPYMSIRIVYRNNLFYYMMMPGLWFSGALIYLGAGWVYAFYIVVKMLVIYGAHSDLRWDKKLYQIKLLSPLMWLLERVISTPSTHSAHHGKHADDGVTHYKGNYGNLLFLWDVLFGTAKITRRYPKAYGVENLPETSAAEQLFWPLIRVKAEDQTSLPVHQ